MPDGEGNRSAEADQKNGQPACRPPGDAAAFAATDAGAAPDRPRDELERRAAELDATLASMVDGLVIYGADGRQTYANRAADEILRYTAAERATPELGERVRLLAFLREDGSPFAVDATPMARALRGEASKRVVMRVPRSEGEIWISVSASPIRGPDGRIRGAVASVRDITKSKQTEAEISWLASFPERNPLPISEVSLAGKIHYLNPSARRLFPDLEAKGLAHPWLSAWPEAVEHLRASPHHVWERIVAVEDGHFQQSLHLLPEVGRVRIYGRDITARVQMEHALHEANQLLREADLRKNEFLAMLSHELRNPLAPVRTSLHVLGRTSPDSEPGRRARAVIERQVAHLTRLVDDLLDITRISRGKIQLRKQPLDLAKLVRRGAEDLRALFVEDGIDLRVAIDGEPLWVDGDGARLGQSLGNLLHNALKFTNRGGAVCVSLARAEGSAVLRVRDTGVGIGANMLAQLFEPFAQAERTLDRSKGGLGLGLALVKGLVTLHGGAISVHSEGLDRGTEFVVRLPLAPAPAAAAAAVAAPGAASPRRRVLVIEDNVDAASSLCEALELGGHEVAVAHQGHEGLAKAREFRPDVILCDIGLPGMDGYQVARAIRDDEGLARVFLVALTGYALPDDLERAVQAGFDRHIAKPPSLEEIEEILGSVGCARADNA